VEYAKLLRQSAMTVAICVGVVVLCYFFIDPPVAFFVHRHRIEQVPLFRWLTYPPPEFQTWSPLALAALCIRRAWGPWSRWQHALFLACLSVIVADQFRYCLGDIAGRYWPETWRHDNPSLIGSGTYGFHPFQRGDDIGSFPSGHAARIVSFAAAMVIAFPRCLLAAAIIAVPMLVSLVAMNYHFVGDVIAGSVLGALYAAGLAGLASRR
jgi:membrane-associated phospholipid phosphatase